MGKILIIRGSDFSQNRIDKVTIVEKPKYIEQVEKTVDSQTLTSTVSVNSQLLKNNN